MSVSVYFNPENLTQDLYDQTMAKLQAAGAGAPAGREYHAAFGAPDHLMVFDVWESAEAFGPTLMPVLEALGINAGEPDVMPLHNVVTG